MMDYSELVKSLREHNGWALNETLDAAADAIEELQAQLMYSNDAAKAIAEKVPKWIPVTERLPEEYVNVLCYCSRNKQYGCGEWSKEDNGTIYWSDLNGMIPTHWMPLPTPPKEETE